MITFERYAQITGDTSLQPDVFARCRDEAVELLEEFLDRPLVEAERTEALRPDRYGNLWPRATPIVEANGYAIDGLALVGASPFGPAIGFLDGSNAVDVTYTGGWVDASAEDWDDEATNQLPTCIVRDLAWAAYRLARPSLAAQATTIPAGATSVSLGDASVSFGPGGAGSSVSLDGHWSRRTRGYRYAPMHTGPDVRMAGI